MGGGHQANTLAIDKIIADEYGNLLVKGTIILEGTDLQCGTVDAYNRVQMWFKIPASVLRLGSLGADGDAQNITSEGIVIYGKNQNGDFGVGNWSLGRFKSTRFGIQCSIDGVYEGYIFRFDVTENEWYIKKNDGTKVFRIFRNENKIELQNLQLNGNLTDGTNNLTFAQIKNAVDNSSEFTTIILLDNKSTPQLLFSYPITKRFSFFLMSIERNGSFKQIYQQIVTDGISVNGGLNTNTAPSPDTTGITLSKAVVGSNVEVYYTSTNTGFNGTFKYKALVQWS